MQYCECEDPIIDVEHDAACRRCARPVLFSIDYQTPPPIWPDGDECTCAKEPEHWCPECDG